MSRAHPWRAAVAALALVVAAAAAPAQSLDPFAGRWTLDPARSDDPAPARDSVVADFPFFARGMVRGRLRALAVAWPALSIARRGADARVVLVEKAPIDVPLTGDTVPWRDEEGRAMRASARLERTPPADMPPLARRTGDVLVVRLLADDGGERRHVLALAGDVLVVDVRVTAPRLRRPLHYRLAYRRAP